jgi:rhamnose transport system ATP-binding protein
MVADGLTAESARPAVIELVGVSKQFGAVQALRSVDLALFPGEVHGLVGENGAGKSTLVKMFAGVHRPDSGSMRIGGEDVGFRSPLDAYHHGVAVRCIRTSMGCCAGSG